MAKGKSQYAARRCPDCNNILQTIRYLKSKTKAQDLGSKKFCKKCKKRVATNVKDIKKAAQ